ncbi:MAG: AraC family transcriptional regulator ligand-binding domain-containing protein, partial [Myxococcota bacterium]
MTDRDRELTAPDRPDSGGRAGPTIAAFVIAGLMRFAASRGLDVAALCRCAGIAPELLAQPDARLPMAAHYALWTEVLAQLDDPGLPIQIASSFRVEDLHVLGFALLTSCDGREALDRTCRYHALLTDSGGWSIVAEDSS